MHVYVIAGTAQDAVANDPATCIFKFVTGTTSRLQIGLQTEQDG